MSRMIKGEYAGAASELVQNLLGEFLADTLERAYALESDLKPGADLIPYRTFAFEAKGQAHNFGQSLLEIVSQRMENYLSAIDALTERRAADLRVYIDTMIDILEDRMAGDATPAMVVRSLPARPAGFSLEDIEVRDVEVILVMLHGAQTHFIEREMQNCGYRVNIITSTIAALEHAVRTKPDMMIISAVMPGLSGVDLTIALSSMWETRNIPIALLTSLARDDELLKAVPDKVPIIRKGEHFGDDLADALSYHFLL